jgi:hypothetical protein
MINKKDKLISPNDIDVKKSKQCNAQPIEINVVALPHLLTTQIHERVGLARWRLSILSVGSSGLT